MKTILITGGAQGIGRGLVEHFLSQGWNVTAVDIQEMAPGDRLETVCGDTSLEETARRAVAKTMERFGRVDALINNAGVGTSQKFKVEDLSLVEWNRVLGINLTGYFLMAKYAAPFLRQTNGTIVNIASTRALMSEPDSEAYAASKGGVVALTHALAVSLGPDVRVNCISPGWIETRENAVHSEADRLQHPAGRVGIPQDIAELADYLLSAGFVTGQNFVADGGMTKKMIYAE
ncbi:MAG: SDR family oxidoreductase [Pontiellaceae bacterium]|jgi:NAD(P)-dependent dehydrogenase (short-subunit alcohol dehydrogenase family)|nr:SDR family oxidoreductase [Pontiellaceae bacterium]